MADLLNTGVSGLIAFQRSLATTGHNISNVNTQGFSRQEVDLSTRIPQRTGSGYIGSGVNANSVRRVYDQFAVEQVWEHTAKNSRLQAYSELAGQVDSLLADPNAGLAPTLQNFFDATQGLADNPSSIPARQVVLSEANALVERFHSIEGRFANLRDANNEKLRNLVDEINAYADSIAELNANIQTARDLAGGEPPNDLLDQRDELIRQLAERVTVRTVEQDSGMMNVSIGTGQPLVTGTNVQGLRIVPSDYDAFRAEIALGKEGSSGPIISGLLTGGELGGVLDFRDDVLDPARNALGRIAIGLTESFNEQHAQGLDLNNEVGEDFFAVTGLSGTTIDAIPNPDNSGGASLTIQIDNASSLTTSDYRLDSDGANLTLVRLSDNKAVETFANAAGTYTSASEGLTLTIDSAAAANDKFLIQPTREASRNIELTVTDPKKIAAASPLRSALVGTNLGTGKISSPEILDIDDPNFFTESIIEMGDTSGDGAVDSYRYSIDDGVSWSAWVTPASMNDDIDINGWRVNITGEPQVGDRFTVEKNSNAVSDNGNALELATLQGKPILENGTTDFQSGYAQMVSDVGTLTRQLEVNSDAQETLLRQAEKTRESISGVNLDEEAANLLKFQQAYQATAQVINVAKNMFDTLIGAVR